MLVAAVAAAAAAAAMELVEGRWETQAGMEEGREEQVVGMELEAGGGEEPGLDVEEAGEVVCMAAEVVLPPPSGGGGAEVMTHG